MKIFIIASIIALLTCGIILLIFPIGWFPSFYDVRYMGWAALFGAAAIMFLPKLIRVPESAPDAERKNKAADLFQLFIAILILSNAIGDLGLYQLYKVGFEFDKFIHFSSSFLSALIIPFVLNKRLGTRLPYAIAVSFFLVVIGGVIWELYEYLADYVFKTHIAGVYGLDAKNDTAFDLTFNTLGALMGVFILTVKRVRLSK